MSFRALELIIILSVVVATFIFAFWEEFDEKKEAKKRKEV